MNNELGFRGSCVAGLATLIALMSAAPALATAATLPKPVVQSLRASKMTLGHTGGKVTLTAKVLHASRCTFASRPSLRGLPLTVTCGSGTATAKVLLPANVGTIVSSYRLGVTAVGSGGRSKPRYVTVKVLPEPPTADLTAAPAGGLTKAGGSATLTATVSRSASCELSASPAIAGLPVSLPCAAGKAPRTVRKVVTLPALTGSASQAYAFKLKVTGPGGTTTSGAAETVWPAMQFGTPTAADPPRSYPAGLSCASASDCVAIDAFGDVVTWNGSSWSAPRRVLDYPPGSVTGMTTAVSCPTTSFCAAVSQTGATALERGGTWAPGPTSGLTSNVSAGASQISCASASLCVAAGADETAIFDGSSWTAPAPMPGGNAAIQSVSCAKSTTFCMATDINGSAYSYDSSGWSMATHFDTSTDPLPEVSCAAPKFCVAVDGAGVDSSGSAFTYTGTWSAATPVSSGTGLNSISCPTSKYCLATGADGNYYTRTSGKWSGSQSGVLGEYDASCTSSVSCVVLGAGGSAGLLKGTNWSLTSTGLRYSGFTTSVSCATSSFCVAVDQTGSMAVYNGSRWTDRPLAGVPNGVGLVSVSCPSVRFCMAVDDQNGLYASGTYVWNGTSWGPGGLPGNYLTSVSCTSRTFCMALGNLNTGVFASIWNGKSWGTQTQIDSPAAYVQISCASATFCAAVDANGDAITFNGTSWSAPAAIDPGVLQPLSTVSCPTSTFCTAMDGFGQAFAYTPTGWSKAVGVENGAGVTSVSCVSAAFCVAADETGNVVTEYDGTWSAPENIDPQSNSNFYGFTSISCATVAFCVAVDYYGNASVGVG